MEQMKPINGYDGMYWITSSGKVWTNYHRNGLERFLNPIKRKDGYLYVNLNKNKKMKVYRVHRLVAEHFIDNPNSKPYVNHIDGTRTNNDVSNLEWCTQKENVHHAIYTLNKWSNSDKQRKSASKLGISKRKLTFETAEKIREEYQIGGTSSLKLSRKYGLSKPCILKILHRKSYVKEGSLCS